MGRYVLRVLEAPGRSVWATIAASPLRASVGSTDASASLAARVVSSDRSGIISSADNTHNEEGAMVGTTTPLGPLALDKVSGRTRRAARPEHCPRV
jgi:hypothetical protein